MLVIAAVAVGVVAPAAHATPPTTTLSNDLGTLWTTVLQTPSAQNSFGNGGQKYACWPVNGMVAPLGPSGVDQCTLQSGTKLFEVGNTFECSTLPNDTPGITEDQLSQCARDHDPQPSVTLDGHLLQLSEVQTPLLHIVLPADNVLGDPAGTDGVSVGDGWVAVVPLGPGVHTIVIAVPGQPTITTKIVVTAS
jgi:hypothetical protein